MSTIQTVFFKTAEQFARDYNVNASWVDTYLLLQVKEKRKPVVVGMTELNLLKALDMVESTFDGDEADDPRNLVYILHID